MNPTDPFGLVGQALDGQYRVEKLVGEGGFSAVYRGQHLGLNEPIAIKCLKLPPSLSTELVDTFVQRFRDESRILYRLSQGNLHIMRSMAAGTIQAPATGTLVPYMILEWLEGRSMATDFQERRARGEKGRGLDEVVKLFDNAADALSYAHGQGVIHRDLNPGNLYITQTPQGQKMKVLDFGVAKLMDDSLGLGPRHQTMGQIRIFAPAYGSPEQFDDAIGPVGAWSDVYSFALVLIEAMLDRPVNDGAHLGEFAQFAIDPNRRPTPRLMGMHVNDEVEATFARATKLNPKERWQNAGDFWKSLTFASRGGSAGVAATQPGGHARTMPLGSPALGGLKSPMQRPQSSPAFAPPRPAAGSPPSAPRVPVVPVPRPPSNRPPAPEPQKSLGTQRMGSVPAMNASKPQAPASMVAPEDEEEVTRVRAPDTDILATMQSDAKATPPPARPAAGMPPIPQVPQAAPVPAPPDSDPEPPSLSGTLVMASPAELPPNFPTGPSPQAPPIQQPPPMQQQAMPQPPMQVPPQHQQPTGPSAAKPHPNQALANMGLAAQASYLGPVPSAPHPGGPQPPVAVPLVNTAAQQRPPNFPSAPGVYPIGTPGQPFPQQQQHAPMGQPMQQQQPFAAQPSEVPAPPTSKTPLFIGLGVLGLLVVVGGIAGLLAVKSSHDRAAASASASISALPTPTPVPTESVTAPPTATPVATETAAPTTTAEPEAPDAAAAVGTATPEATATATATATAPTATTTTTATATGTAAWTPPTATTATAKPSAAPNAFDAASARARLGAANSTVGLFCKGPVGGPGAASVTFGPDGSVAAVAMEPPYAGTPQGACAEKQFRTAKVSPYEGSAMTIRHTFELPKP